MAHSDVYDPVHNELWALSVMASTLDNVRLRVFGLQPDVQQERPQGFARSLAQVLSSLRRGEVELIAVVEQALKTENPTLNTIFNRYPKAFVLNPAEELGSFMDIRETSLGLLRGLTSAQWERKVNDPERGLVSLIQLAVERANLDLEEMDYMAQLRHAIVQLEPLQGNDAR
ncbi:hypothetical protein [Herpetosiphon sp. NSE202]|uniref:hypothetical protein n=1 Tax=Herpetosiphon sp. NSE202 TaxID=3351349 RepID=UPI003637B0F6